MGFDVCVDGCESVVSQYDHAQQRVAFSSPIPTISPSQSAMTTYTSSFSPSAKLAVKRFTWTCRLISLETSYVVHLEMLRRARVEVVGKTRFLLPEAWSHTRGGENRLLTIEQHHRQKDRGFECLVYIKY